MTHRNSFLSGRATGWLIALALLLAAGAAAAQQDPPGRVGRIDIQQGAVSFSPAGGNDWFEANANRPITTGDRLWTDRDARAELHLGADTLRLDAQTGITVSELDDDTARITASQGRLQLRVREELGGRRLEIGTPNLAAVVDGPGDYRIETDPAAGITRVAVASGRLTLFGEGGESVALGAHQQLVAAGRNLAAASGAPTGDDNGFDRWVAERDRIEEQSISARYVSREVVGYQQLDAYGDWQSDPTYGNVWYPRGVDAEWAPYRDGQWVDVAPWGWTWVDAAPWGFAPAHYGRWARIGPRWGWVPGQRHVRPVYSPALVGFVGGAAGASANLAIGGGRNGVGWFPLAPGEAWRPGYRASQRYVDEANRAAFQRQIAARQGGFAHQQVPGAVTVVPSDQFGRGPAGRRDVVRLPANQLSGVPVGMGAPIPLGDHGRGGFGRPGMPPPPQAAMQARQFEQMQQVQQVQQARQIQQQQIQQRAVQAQAAQAQAIQAQQMQMLQQAQQAQQMQQAQRLQQAQQMQQAQQLQQAQQMQQAQQIQRQQIEAQQRAAQAQAQAHQQMQQQAMRQQQEAQQRAAQAQAQQLQAMQQLQAQRAQQQVQAQQQMLQAQQAQAHAIRQAQEIQQRAAQVPQQQRMPQRSGVPAPGQQQQPDRP